LMPFSPAFGSSLLRRTSTTLSRRSCPRRGAGARAGQRRVPAAARAGGHRAGSGPGPINTVRTGAGHPTAVAIRLPPLPAYHSAKMDLRARSIRGEVVLARPKLDRHGHKKWHPPVSDCPTLTLYARVVHGAKYKESVTGDAIWPEILATPTGTRRRGIPHARNCCSSSGGTPGSRRSGKHSAPGYRRAYGWLRWFLSPSVPVEAIISGGSLTVTARSM